jgi:hypothetical protein
MPDRPDPLTDPVARTLARFTPTAGGLDRDGLLFAAGRASAPKLRWWKRATAVLLVTQMATLAVWLRPAADRSPAPAPEAPAAVEPPTAPAPLPPDSYGAFVRAVGANGLPPPTPAPGDPPADGPTLSVASGYRGLTLE